MKSIKIMLTIFSFLFIAGMVSAQSTEKGKKGAKKVHKKIAKLNQRLMDQDPTLALTDNQKAQIISILQKSRAAIKEATKGVEDRKAVAKPIKKAAKKQIAKEVLTKAQRTALKKARMAKRQSKGKKRT